MKKINTSNIKGIELWLQNVPYNDRLENTFMFQPPAMGSDTSLYVSLLQAPSCF